MKLLPFSLRFLIHFLLFFGAFFALGEGRFGLVTLLLCAFGLTLIHHSLARSQPNTLHLGKALAFVPFFLYHSFLGALAVARLALRKRVDFTPHYHTLTLSGSPASNAITANIFSLMPGTLSVSIKENALTLHVLDISVFDPDLIATTHQRLEGLFVPNKTGCS